MSLFFFFFLFSPFLFSSITVDRVACAVVDLTRDPPGGITFSPVTWFLTNVFISHELTDAGILCLVLFLYFSPLLPPYLLFVLSPPPPLRFSFFSFRYSHQEAKERQDLRPGGVRRGLVRRGGGARRAQGFRFFLPRVECRLPVSRLPAAGQTTDAFLDGTVEGRSLLRPAVTCSNNFGMCLHHRLTRGGVLGFINTRRLYKQEQVTRCKRDPSYLPSKCSPQKMFPAGGRQ